MSNKSRKHSFLIFWKNHWSKLILKNFDLDQWFCSEKFDFLFEYWMKNCQNFISRKEKLFYYALQKNDIFWKFRCKAISICLIFWCADQWFQFFIATKKSWHEPLHRGILPSVLGLTLKLFWEIFINKEVTIVNHFSEFSSKVGTHAQKFFKKNFHDFLLTWPPESTNHMCST